MQHILAHCNLDYKTFFVFCFVVFNMKVSFWDHLQMLNIQQCDFFLNSW